MKKTFTILLTATSLATAAIASGQSVAQPDWVKGSLSAFHGNQHSLIRMVRSIEQSTHGHVLDVRFTPVDGRPGYHAVIARRGRIEFVHFQEETKHVVQIEEESAPEWMLGWRGRRDVRLTDRAAVPLTHAIRTAENSANGAPAFAAGIAHSASNPTSDVHAYTVLLDVDGHVDSVSVDDSSGEIIANPSALSY